MDFQHHIACPHCDAINRVPGERLSESPKCGKCKAALFSRAPIELTDANFTAHIQRTSNGQEAARQAGAMDAHRLAAWIRGNI